MIESIDGIIIKEMSYKESSKILTIITKKYGLISVLAKGAKKPNSGLSFSTSKFTHGMFNVIYKQEKLSILISVDILSPLYTVKTDVSKIGYLNYLMTLFEQVVKAECSNEVYDIFISGLNKIDEGLNPLGITNIIELKMLQYLGIKPIVDECSICKSNNVVTISVDKGGFICENCVTYENIVNINTIKFIRMFYYIDISKISKFEIEENILNEINTFIDSYYDKYTGIYQESKKYIYNYLTI